jgi:hypothetical protein
MGDQKPTLVACSHVKRSGVAEAAAHHQQGPNKMAGVAD